MAIEALGGSFEVGEVTIVDEQRVTNFDRDTQRAGAALVVPGLDPTGAMPARFVGDGLQGFAARLEVGERLVLAREAVVLRGSFGIQFAAQGGGAIRCGLLGRDGSVLASTSCTPAVVNSVETRGSEAPVAVFFELEAGAEPIELDDISVRFEHGPSP